ncbi:tRNA (adenine(22)-N(1))-methyltransferase [Desulfovirgula thermocuniculi]|uniref:tRNA (adenine(22)-N(1))-methyltransferase n=1 Tax=Desulfovirgula thermocuniculi TaxID=348842 RepID=UPI000684CCE7|nr:class I SAM-dependent methyltransferase [Desulfovirgula thermocuniculi]
MLTKRLAAVAAFVPPGAVVADVGTDHALLPVYLVESGICPHAIATELNDGPYRHAFANICRYGLEEKISLRQGDGLAPLCPGEADVVVLAGMGGRSIVRILSSSPEVLAATRRLILQPMTDVGELRSWLADNGWRLVDEDLVEEEGRLYPVIVAEPGREEVSDPFLLEVGPRLVEKGHPLLPDYLERLKAGYEKVLGALSCSCRPQALAKAREIIKKISRLEEVLALAGSDRCGDSRNRGGAGTA